MEKAFLAELDHQVLPDGGHASRNPAVVVELLLDLLPLRQCYVARHIVLPAALLAAIDRMIALPEISCAAATARWRASTARAARKRMHWRPFSAMRSRTSRRGARKAKQAACPTPGYRRLQRESTIILMDTGPPPALAFSGQAHAGCLSFEMSYGSQPLLVNAGAPAAMPDTLRRRWRARPSATTPCASTRRRPRVSLPLEGTQSQSALQLPAEVYSTLTERDGSLVLEAWHDGYLDQYGLLHARCLVLSQDGERLDGMDRLEPPSGVLRTRQDLPFSIQFRAPPEAICRLGQAPETAEIQIGPHSYWRFTAAGARLSVEESVDLVHLSGPRRSMQIVLRGACPGEIDGDVEPAARPGR